MSVSTGRRAGVGLALVVVVLIAGCSGGSGLAGGGGGSEVGQQSGAEVDVAESGDAPAAEAGERGDGGGGGADAGGGSGDGQVQIRDRAIIRTGEVHLRVEDFDAAQRNLTATVERYGGFVSDSRVEVERVGNTTFKRGELVFRVPRENFSAVMRRAQAVGELESVSRNSKDVTEKLVDLEARLANLRAERERLRQLYRNASDTEDVLAVEERLSEVQGEIERLEARQQALQRQVALSTVRVRLHEPRPDPGPIDTDRWFDTPVLKAFLQSVDGVITSLRALVVAGAYGLPYAFVYGPLIVGVAYGVRRLRRKRGGSRLDAVPGVSPGASDGDDVAGTSGRNESGDEPGESDDSEGDAGPDESEGSEEDGAGADDGDDSAGEPSAENA